MRRRVGTYLARVVQINTYDKEMDDLAPLWAVLGVGAFFILVAWYLKHKRSSVAHELTGESVQMQNLMREYATTVKI
jgi:hypothetical protein